MGRPVRRPRAAWVCIVASCAAAAAAISLAEQGTLVPSAPVVPPAVLPATRPATTPAGVVPAADGQPTFPEELKVLASRSMFVRGHGAGAGGRGGAERLAGARLPGGGASVAGTPQGYILRGVARQGAELTAFVEDLTAQATRQVHVGEDVAGGRVAAITADGLDHATSGRSLHVIVGQLLDGTRPTADAPPATQPAIKPAGAVAAAVEGDAARAEAGGAALPAPVAASAKILPTPDKP